MRSRRSPTTSAGNGKSQILATQGFVKLVRVTDGPVVGVHMVGARVGELDRRGPADLQLGRLPGGRGLPGARPPDPERGARRGPPRAGGQTVARPLLTCWTLRLASTTETENERAKEADVDTREPPRTGRVRHRRHHHPLAEVGGRHRRGRRAVARGLHRQGRHRDPLPCRRHAAGDQGRGGRDRRGRRRAVRHRRRGRGRRFRPGRLRRSPTTTEDDSRGRRRVRGVRVRGVRSEDSEDADSGDDSEDSSEDDESMADEEEEQKPAEPKKSGGGGGGTPVTLPALGESVTEGTITRWLKSGRRRGRGGRAAARGLHRQGRHRDPLTRRRHAAGDQGRGGRDRRGRCRARASSATAPASSTTQRGRAGAGGEGRGARAGARARAGAEPEPEPEPEPEAKKEKEPEPEPRRRRSPRRSRSRRLPKAAGQAEASSGESGSYVTPLVRKMAAEHGVDLASIEGTGVGGRIRKQDVLAAAESAKPAAEEPAAQAGQARRHRPRRRARCAARPSR